jgi:hypothetical protein
MIIFWLVLKLEISYDILKDFGFFFKRVFLRIIFLHGEIFEFFHNSFFSLRYFLM